MVQADKGLTQGSQRVNEIAVLIHSSFFLPSSYEHLTFAGKICYKQAAQ